MISTFSLSDVQVLATGLDHPEGIAAGPDGMLYAGGEAGQVYRIDPADGTTEQIADTGGFVLGVSLDGNGTIYACDSERRAIVRIDPATGEVDAWCESVTNADLRLPNWGAFAEDGSFIFSDSGSEEVPDGKIIKVPPGGGAGEALDLPPLHFPNGLTVAPDGKLYVLESFTPRLQVVNEGRLELVCELPGVVPDGVAIDVDGGFIIACYYPFRLLRVPPGASDKPTVLIDDAQALRLLMPTNVCFFGDDLSRLAIAGLGGYDINAIDIGVCGVPLHYPV